MLALPWTTGIVLPNAQHGRVSPIGLVIESWKKFRKPGLRAVNNLRLESRES